MIWQIWFLVPNVQFQNVALTSTLLFAHAASHDDIVEIQNQVFCLTPPFIGSLDDFLDFRWKTFHDVIVIFTNSSESTESISSLTNNTKFPNNVSSYGIDHHFRCQNIIYIIFYIALCSTMNYEEGWGWGLLVLLYCLSTVVANESTFLQWLSAFSVFWNAFFHMFLSLLYCLLVNSLFC